MLTDTLTLPKPLALDQGGSLEVSVRYNTYGTRAADDSNVVLVLHALTGSADVHEWWSGLVGEGRLIDPSKHFIIVPNAIGSCYGSSGPESIDAATGEVFGHQFPELTIRDIARANLALLTQLRIGRVALGIGGSMGGMVLLEMAALDPERFASLLPIAVAADHSPWRIAFSSTIRKAIAASDPTLKDRTKLEAGLRIARQFAMASYRCATEFNARFTAETVESYLEHHGNKIVERFSTYSYLALTRAMESYNLRKGRHELRSLLSMPALFVGISSDVLFDDGEIRSFAKELPRGEYRTLFADHGHDSFLVDTEELVEVIESFVSRALIVREEVTL